MRPPCASPERFGRIVVTSNGGGAVCAEQTLSIKVKINPWKSVRMCVYPYQTVDTTFFTNVPGAATFSQTSPSLERIAGDLSPSVK
jgi:hypothetical protein